MATPRQRKAAEALVENSRLPKPKKLGEVLGEVGYSKATQIKPTQVTKSDGFLEALEEAGVTDDNLSRVISEGLNANKVITSHTEPDREYPDHNARHKFLETSLRLKGHSKDPSPNIVIVPIYSGRSVE